MVYSDESLADLEDIWDFLAGESEQAASRVVNALISFCQRLSQFPYSHQTLPGLPKPDVRRAVLRHWVILYEVHQTHIAVLRIVHGGRDLRALALHD